MFYVDSMRPVPIMSRPEIRCRANASWRRPSAHGAAIAVGCQALTSSMATAGDYFAWPLRLAVDCLALTLRGGQL